MSTFCLPPILGAHASNPLVLTPSVAPSPLCTSADTFDATIITTWVLNKALSEAARVNLLAELGVFLEEHGLVAVNQDGSPLVTTNVSDQQLTLQPGAVLPGPGSLLPASGTIEHLRRYHVHVSGTARAYQCALGVTLCQYALDAGAARTRAGLAQLGTPTAANQDTFVPSQTTYFATDQAAALPSRWQYRVLAILGLENYPLARTHVRLGSADSLAPRATAPSPADASENVPEAVPEASATTTATTTTTTTTTSRAVAYPPYTPAQVASAYQFPAGVAAAAGQTVAVIGIIQLGGGYVASEIQAYLQRVGSTFQTSTQLSWVSVSGGTNNLADTNVNANYEVYLDVQMVCALAPPGARVRVYFAPNSLQAFLLAISNALQDKCTVISISWGLSEALLAGTNIVSLFNTVLQTSVAQGTTILAASGDNGSSSAVGGLGADFPGTSPYVLSCGGTVMANTGAVETTWTGSGGGASPAQSAPAYQASTYLAASLRRRCVPDVAGVASPDTGFLMGARGGGTAVLGGTSAVAPLYAALVARLQHQLGQSRGLAQAQTILYTPSGTLCCRDVLSGSNGAYAARAGWDACTGLGSLNGTQWLTLLRGLAAPAPPPPVIVPPTPTPAPLQSAFVVTLVSGATIQCTDTSTGGPILTWQWTFGDGTTSALRSPAHTYAQSGSYVVQLRVVRAGAVSSTWTRPTPIAVRLVATL